MFKNGLLVLSTSSFKVDDVLKRCCEYVSKFLYVHLVNTKDLSNITYPLKRTKSISKFINSFYSLAATEFNHLDLVFITSNFTNITLSKRPQHNLSKDYEVVLTDIDENDDKKIKQYVQKYFPNKNPIEFEVKKLLNLQLNHETPNNIEPLLFHHSCVGGTFDHFHAGHKILLNQTLLSTDHEMSIGVTEGDINKKKVLCDLLEPLDKRIATIKEFLSDSDPSKKAKLIPIYDPFGPTVTDPSIDCLIVSEETLKGGNIVNEERKKLGMSELKIEVMNLVVDGEQEGDAEMKVSSTKARKRLLGTLLRPPKVHKSNEPYIIGLTGSIASGKSSVAKRLEGLGAGVINCDVLGHESYLPGTSAYYQIIQHFGDRVVNKETKLIDRSQLGAIVFKDNAELALLNSIVWPAIRNLVTKYILELFEKGKRVIVLDAAVLLEADWDEGTHEVWVAVIDPSEAEKRIVERNGLTVEQARERISSQMSNHERLKKANVVLCTQWQYEYTQKQEFILFHEAFCEMNLYYQVEVERAWKLLHERLQ